MPVHPASGAMLPPEFLQRYDRTAIRAAREVIDSYSTSFSLATRLLAKPVRTDIRNLYAVVRIADEIVDGATQLAGFTLNDTNKLLDDYEHAVLAAPKTRFHTDLVLHAYAMTARRCHFNPEHIAAFFSSMRRDLQQSTHDRNSFEDYIYGSAEVIGLLCLSVFLVDHPVADADRARMEHGARSLGVAFQKINFLRDLAEDSTALGREYFPELAEHPLSEADKQSLIDDIRHELHTAGEAIPLLPLTSRTGVLGATNLFSELTDRLEALPAEELVRRRVSVPGPVKARILARTVVAAPSLSQKKRHRN